MAKTVLASALLLVLSACGAPASDANLASMDTTAPTGVAWQAMEEQTKVCSGTRGPGGGSATCALTDACGTVAAPDGKNYRGVCIPAATACPELKATYELTSGDQKVTLTITCAKGVTTVTYPKGVGSDDKDMRCYSLKKGDPVLRDGANNGYAPPTGDKETRFVCFASDGGAYSWQSGGESSYFDPKGTKVKLALAPLVDEGATTTVITVTGATDTPTVTTDVSTVAIATDAPPVTTVDAVPAPVALDVAVTADAVALP